MSDKSKLSPVFAMFVLVAWALSGVLALVSTERGVGAGLVFLALTVLMTFNDGPFRHD